MADATSGGTNATGLPKGLTLNSSGTITGSIDTGVTPGEYVAIITVTYSSNSKTEVSPVLPSSSVHALTSPNRIPYPQALP
ncbi:putative Ig domain-containing protein [Tropheryma whipplei]|uniref:putative Ig domain-containing protein n=1 Tax=Tropheryma whipplei TaxID=2039 RepID=UPI0003058388|nr:putative Ig domain-containing protein [Tropheryma whipplei]